MVVNSIKEIINRERFIIKSLQSEVVHCESCREEAIQYHLDIIYYLENTDSNDSSYNELEKIKNLYFEGVLDLSAALAKQIKILEILKKSNLDLDFIRLNSNYGLYKARLKANMMDLEINEKEFKLLKEWLDETK